MIKPISHTVLTTFTLVSMIAITNRADASGLQISEQSVAALGRAFAGGSLPNDDLSAAYYNPADLMLLGRGTHVQTGMTLIGINMTTDNAGSTLRLPANLKEVLTKPSGTVVPVFVTVPTAGRSDDGGTDKLVPNGYYVTDINDQIRFGLSFNAPFAVSTSYGKNWVGRYHALDSDLLTLDINPSIAYRINDHLSVGGGLSAQYAKSKLTQALFNPLNPAQDGHAEIEGDDWGWGFNLGATYEFDADTRIGLSYRSRIKYTLEGDRTISHYLPGRNGETPAEVAWTAPDWAGFGFYKRLNNQWAVMVGARWTNWSLFQELRAKYADGMQTVLDEKWEDSWSFNLGVSYDYTPEWTFRAGYVYDQTPIPSAAYRTPRIPDNDRNAVGIGFSYHPHPQWALDFGYMHIWFEKANSISTIDLLPVPGLVTDTLRLSYEGDGNLLGLQATYRF